METLIKKRKKRKTRRCLDELRKKTHQTKSCGIITGTDVRASKSYCLTKSNCITSNRLTLNKSIRSETVTRLHLSKTENNKISEFITDSTNIETVKSNFQKYIVPYKTQNYQTLSSQIDITSDTENESPKPQINDETPKSIMLFSPESQDEEVNTKLNNSLEVYSLLSSSSSSTSSSNFDSDQDEFMDYLECYIKKTFPQALNCDFIEKNRESLVNLHMQNFGNNRKESTSDVARENNFSNTQESPMIIQNPKAYLGYAWKECPDSNTSAILISSPTNSPSAESMYIPTSSPVTSIVYDSPEYSYYPHRLN